MNGYDTSNIFAKILRGELPCHKIYEDEATLAFLDIMPRSEGHCLVIPKSPTRNLLDASPDIFAALMQTTQRCALAVMKTLKADGITIQQFNESAAGQMVFHLHMHIIPRFEGVKLEPHSGHSMPEAKLISLTEQIRKHMV